MFVHKCNIYILHCPQHALNKFIRVLYIVIYYHLSAIFTSILKSVEVIQVLVNTKWRKIIDLHHSLTI